MKYFRKFSKMILWCIIGGMLAFTAVFISSYLKASGVAGDISRNALLLATQEGCINQADVNRFCENMAESYGTKNLLVCPDDKDSFSSDREGSLVRYFTRATSGTWDPVAMGNTYCTTGLIGVTDNSGVSLINDTVDYEKHVQRGEVINVTATVEVNMHLNFIMRSRGNNTDTEFLRFTIPVSAETSGISCKWFKGE